MHLVDPLHSLHLRLTYRISGDLLECMYVTQFFLLINFTLRTQVVFGCLSVAMEIKHGNFCAKPTWINATCR